MAPKLLIPLLAAWLAAAPASGAAVAPAPPPWRALTFEERHLWLRATSTFTLSVEPAPADWGLPAGTRLWHLEVASAVASNREQIRSWFDPQSGRVLLRERESAGRDRRFKRYRFTPQGVIRERLEPAPGEEDLPRARWSKVQRRLLPYPPELGVLPLLTPEWVPVFAAASPLARVSDRIEVALFGDLGFHLGQLAATGRERLGARVSLGKGADCLLAGPRETLLVTLATEPLGDSPEAGPELLGMAGPHALWLEGGHRLPLAVGGEAPRAGRTRVPLVAAVLTVGSCREEPR